MADDLVESQAISQRSWVTPGEAWMCRLTQVLRGPMWLAGLGILVWLVLKHPDTSPRAAATPAISYLPARQREDVGRAT